MNLTIPTIELAKEIQANLNLKDTHLVWFGQNGFTIAHTDQERQTINLENCLLHKALVYLDSMPEGIEEGWYKVSSGGECLYNAILLDSQEHIVNILNTNL